MKVNEFLTEEARPPSDEEYNRAKAALKDMNPKLVIGGIGVEPNGDINIEATLPNGSVVDEFILRKNGKMDLVNESVGSEIKRKLQGKVSGKEQIRRVALSVLQQVVDRTSRKELTKLFGEEPDINKIHDWLDITRKDAIKAIKLIKAVEK